MLCGTVFAEDTVKSIVFKDSGTANDGSAAKSTIADIISEGDTYVSAIPTATKVYQAREGRGLKLGTSSAKGELTLTLAKAVKPTKITFDARKYNDTELSITVNGKEVTDLNGDFDTYTINYDGNTEVSSIEISTPAKRAYITNVKIYEAEATPEPQPYTYDFNTSIATSNHGFILGSNWGHVVGTDNYDNYGPYYMNYSYTSDGGYNNTGSLCANRQYAGDNQGGSVCYDLLVTPLVSGKITMKVKASSSASSSNPSFVEIYKIDAAGTTRGDLIQRFTESEGYTAIEGQDDWKEITLTLTEEQRIAIRAQYVYLDDFTAAVVNIIPQKALSVISVMNMEGKTGTEGSTTYFEQQADGTLSVPLKVLLSNTGDVDLISGTTENYTLTLATASYTSGTKTYYDEVSVNIPKNLAVGASDTVEVTFNIPYSSGWKYFFVKENITGTTSSTSRYAGTTAYEPIFVFRAAESTATSSITGAQAYGLVSENTTRNFEITNTGTAPLTIKSITLPEGFTSANMPEIPTEGLVIAKGASQALDITLPATTLGDFSGNLTIVYLDKDGAEKTFTLAFSGNVLPAGTWATNFDNASSTPAYPAGSIAESGINSDYSYNSGTYEIYLMGRKQSSYASGNNKFITPKLHATAGQQLTFDIKGAYGNSYYAKVYVSTDRKTWGEPVATFTYAETEGAEAIGSSDWVNKAVTFETEGDYYVAFALYGEFKIDNIIGLTKVDVAHDLYIKSVNWPDASVKSGTSLSKPTVDIIPLSDETAEAYTVKYVCGETVLAEATAAELTASASSSKTFNFSWTPQVESTTKYEGSKIVFEFTDGTKYETEGFDLTVTNEPIFHFVNSIPSSKWYEPTDYTTPVAFGKTNTADKKTFYVYNWGSAPLTVKSITAPDGFTATPAGEFTVAAFDENDMSAAAQAVEITFSATHAATYNGDMVITYLDGTGTEKTFTLALSGTKLDPTKFYANFGTESDQWPAGSVYQKNISKTNGGTYNAPNYYITSSNTTDNIFITPKLTAAIDDTLKFDAKLYSTSWSEGKVTVYAAATREEVLNAEEGTTRVMLFSVSGEDTERPMTTDFQTFEAPIHVAGDYYIGIEISGRAYVDEIYGLTPATVAHDLKIASSYIPTSGMQNITYATSVNVQNFGLAEEAADGYAMTVYVNNEAVATGETVAIPMNHKLDDAGTKIAASFRYPKAGTFPVYVEVKAGEYSVATEPVDVVFAEEVASSTADMAGNGTSGDAPLNLNYKNSESITLYNAETLAGIGLANGSKISSITYKGYKTSEDQTTSFQVYYKWTDNQTLEQPATDYPYAAADNGMTSLIDEDHTWTAVGSSSELGDMLVLNFSEPLVYEAGKSLCIYMHSYVDGYKAAYFEKSTLSSDFCYARRQDAATLSSGWSKTTPAAVHFALVAEATTISGTVKNSEGAAIENATVTLVSTDGEGVQYEGKTDAEGAYSFNVIQTSRTYNATVVASEDYKTATAEISFAEGSVIKDFVLADTNPLGDANLDGEVTTSDAVAAVTFALEKEVPSEKALKVADVNKSGNITVSDAVGIVNIALNAETPAPARGEMEAVNFLTKNGTSLNLINSTEFVGFQMDVTLAEGAMLNGVSLNDRAANLQVVFNRIADNTYRIIAFSTGNAAIEGNEGELISLDITGNDNIAISNIEFADAAANAYALSLTETTGINGIYAGAANVESYTVGGVKNDKVRKGMNIVRTADGKVKKVLVK